MTDVIREFIRHHNVPRKLVLISDLFLVAIAFAIAYVLRLNMHIGLISLPGLLIKCTGIVLPVYFFSFLLTGSYRGLLRFSQFEDFGRLFLANIIAAGMVLVFSVISHWNGIPDIILLPYSVAVIHAVLTFGGLVSFRLLVRTIYQAYGGQTKRAKQRVLIFGAGEMGQITRNIIEHDGYSNLDVAGFIDDKKALAGKQIAGKQIYSEDQAFELFVKSKAVKEIIIAVSSKVLSPVRKKNLLDRCIREGLTVKEVPPFREWMDGSFSTRQMREVKIEDLLGRDPIWLDMDNVAKKLKNSVVLVTGAAGSIGSEIVRQLLGFDPEKVILVDQAESPLYDLQFELKNCCRSCFEVVMASVTDAYRMRAVFERFRPQYVFHAAAYKHVPLMEGAPYLAVRTNVGGTKIMANLSVEFGVEKFVMISTDKAVNPTNVMGASKRICEIYIQSLAQSGSVTTQFITTRFGNVLGSNGSVVPLFKKQIEAGGPVTVTHKDIIRYFMTIPEACQLVLEAGFMGRGGEIYVFDMGEPVKIYDLAVKMISLAGYKPEEEIAIRVTGLRPGEKLYEELLADKECTVPTLHPKIKAAKVREYEFDLIQAEIESLVSASQSEPEDELVHRMKAIVPEFISQNSEYCKYDQVSEQEKTTEEEVMAEEQKMTE